MLCCCIHPDSLLFHWIMVVGCSSTISSYTYAFHLYTEQRMLNSDSVTTCRCFSLHLYYYYFFCFSTNEAKQEVQEKERTNKAKLAVQEKEETTKGNNNKTQQVNTFFSLLVCLFVCLFVCFVVACLVVLLSFFCLFWVFCCLFLFAFVLVVVFCSLLRFCVREQWLVRVCLFVLFLVLFVVVVLFCWFVQFVCFFNKERNKEKKKQQNKQEKESNTKQKKNLFFFFVCLLWLFLLFLWVFLRVLFLLIVGFCLHLHKDNSRLLSVCFIFSCLVFFVELFGSSVWTCYACFLLWLWSDCYVPCFVLRLRVVFFCFKSALVVFLLIAAFYRFCCFASLIVT